GGRQPVGDERADGGAYRRGDQRVAPLPGGEQLASVEGVAGGRRAEGGAQLVGAQHQVRRQAGGEQRGDGQQATAAGDGIDESGGEGDEGEDQQGSRVDTQLEGKGHKKLEVDSIVRGRCWLPARLLRIMPRKIRRRKRFHAV